MELKQEIWGKSRTWIIDPVNLAQTPTKSAIEWFVDWEEGNRIHTARVFKTEDEAIRWARAN